MLWRGFGWVVAACLSLTGCIELPPEPAQNERLAAKHAPTLSLSTGDGTELDLVGLEVRGTLQTPLAFTELHLTFENPEDRVLAGEFMIELPHGASPARFAMKVGDQWQEGEVVERQRARAIYSEILHNGADPALLEKQVGNRFRAKVFPIPPRGRKELILSYTQVHDEAGTPHRVALRGLGPIESYRVDFLVHECDEDELSTGRIVQAEHRDFTPNHDLLIEDTCPAQTAVRSDAGVAARVLIPGDIEGAPLEPLTIAFDTSASRVTGYAAHVQNLQALIVEIARTQPLLPIHIVAFDQDVESIFEGPAARFGMQPIERLLARNALGASDLSGLFESLAAAAPERVVLLTDGLITAGATELDALQTSTKRLRDGGTRRLDVILDAHAGSDELLAGVVHDGFPSSGVLARADEAPLLVHKLSRPVLGPVFVDVEGATSTWPSQLRGTQPGDTVVVYGAGALRDALRVDLSGALDHHATINTRHVPSPLVQHSIAAATIAQKTKQWSETSDPAAKSDLRDAIVSMSIDQRVLSDFTAMLVLESPQDFRRYGIDRYAKLEMLEMSDDGLTLATVHRKNPPPPTPPSHHELDDSAQRHRGEEGVMGLVSSQSGHFLASPAAGAFAIGNDDSEVWGGLGDIGEPFDPIEHVEFERTSHRGLRRPRWKTPPKVDFSVERTHGLSRRTTQRIARYRSNTIRSCYEAELAKTAKLRGSLSLTFNINDDGTPIDVSATSEQLPKIAKNCIETAVRHWQFPSPRVDDANVELSLVFEPGVRAKHHLRKSRPHRPRHRSNPVPRDVLIAEETPAYSGSMAQVMSSLENGDRARASELARAWRRRAPRDVLALVALGEAMQAEGRNVQAARAYGSIIDLYPSDAPKLRYASARLQTVGQPGETLAIDAARQAVDEHPDHPSSHHNLAWALVNAHQYEAAFAAITRGTEHRYGTSLADTQYTLTDDAMLISAAWIAAEPQRSHEIRTLARTFGILPAAEPSTHFVLSWETDANDVDLHVFDADGYHAWYRDRGLPDGGRLYTDITDGYGPESFTFDGSPQHYPYRIGVHYFRRGAMGHGLGAVRIIQHDGRGGIELETVPFVLMSQVGRSHIYTLEDPADVASTAG